MQLVLEDGEQVWKELFQTDVVSEGNNVIEKQVRGVRESPTRDMAISDLKD